MKYQKVIDRINSSYSYGPINLPNKSSLLYTNPDIKDGATFRRAVNGATILLGANVAALKGSSKITADGDQSFVAVGAKTTFENTEIQINGKNSAVIIGEGCRLRGLKIIVRRENSIVVIGSKTTWESGAVLSESGNIVAIGNDCMVSSGVILRTSDGHSIFDAKTQTPLNESADVIIGHHVWLGNSSRVSKGASIGSGVVLGQCAIATKRLEGNCIYAGTPARKIRSGIVWSRTDSFNDIPSDYLIDNVESFDDLTVKTHTKTTKRWRWWR